MIYLFEMAGLGSYIRGWGIGSKNVQECSFMHKFVLLMILQIRLIVNWVAIVRNLKTMGPQKKSLGNTGIDPQKEKNDSEEQCQNANMF